MFADYHWSIGVEANKQSSIVHCSLNSFALSKSRFGHPDSISALFSGLLSAVMRQFSTIYLWCFCITHYERIYVEYIWFCSLSLTVFSAFFILDSNYYFPNIFLFLFDCCDAKQMNEWDAGTCTMSQIKCAAE